MIAVEFQPTQKYAWLQNRSQTELSHRIIAVQNSDPPEPITERFFDNRFRARVALQVFDDYIDLNPANTH